MARSEDLRGIGQAMTIGVVQRRKHLGTIAPARSRPVASLSIVRCTWRFTHRTWDRPSSAVPEVVGVGTVTGDADAIVHIRLHDLASLKDALESVRVAPKIDHTCSTIMITRFIDRRNQ